MVMVLVMGVTASADNVLVRPWGENALRVQVSPEDWTLTVCCVDLSFHLACMVKFGNQHPTWDEAHGSCAPPQSIVLSDRIFLE